METTPRARPFPWKAVLLLLLAMVVGSVVLVVGILDAGNRRWQLMERRIAELRSEIERRDGSRIPFGKNPRPGNAWPQYLKAVAALGPRTESMTLLAFARNRAGVDPQAVDTIVRSRLDALRFLVDGARSAQAEPPLSDVPVDTDALAWLAVARSRLLARDGNVEEAAGLLTDVLQFGTDVADAGTGQELRSGLYILNESLGAMPDLLDQPSLSRERIAELDRTLARFLEEFHPLQASRKVETLWMGNTLLRSENAKGGFDVSGSWRFGYSRRWMAAEAFEAHLEITRLLGETDPLIWRDAGRAIDTWVARAIQNPAVDGISGGFAENHAQGCWLIRARVQLLRARIGHRLNGALPDLPDPFGGRLRSEQTPAGIRVWSVGIDGVDQGGHGHWRSGIDPGSDLVLKFSP